MTKVIAVLRHAQSVGKQTGERDYDRSLTPLGMITARTLGQKLITKKINFELIVSSAALRTRQTVRCLNEVVALADDRIHFVEELYDALAAQWLDHIHKLPDDIDRVLLVGHNPWLSLLATGFAGSICELGTCEMAVFEFECDAWHSLPESGKNILNLK
jgi:phosphohistidine phosphatase